MESAPHLDRGEFISRPFGIVVTAPVSAGSIVSQAFVHLLADPADLERVMGRMAEKVAGGARFEIAVCGSNIHHQQRHFHDLLATPLGAQVLQALAELSDPLDEVCGVLRNEASCSVPLHDSSWPNLQPAAAKAASALDRLNRLLGRSPSYPDSLLETRHLLEASALAVQSASLVAITGAEEAISFARQLAQRPDSVAHTRCWGFLNSISDQIDHTRSFDPAVASAFVFFALCGRRVDGAEWSHPVDRLNAIAAYLLHTREFPAPGTAIAVLDRISELIDVPTLDECLAADADTTLPEAWQHPREQMIAAIRADPSAYLDPVLYLAKASRWPSAPVWVAVAEEHATQPFVDELVRGGWHECARVGGEVLLGGPGPDEALDLAKRVWAGLALWRREPVEPLFRAAGIAALEARLPGVRVTYDQA